MKKEWQDRLNQLLETGRYNKSDDGEISDLEVRLAIELIKHSADIYPDYLLQSIVIVASFDMIPLSLSILLAKGPDKYLSNPIKKNNISHMMSHLNPEQLLEIAENLQSKVFGRGLGSRPQKMIRKVMENWSDMVLEEYVLKFNKEFIILSKIIHPKFKKDGLIKILMEEE